MLSIGCDLMLFSLISSLCFGPMGFVLPQSLYVGASQENPVYVRESSSEVYLANDFLEIGFVKNTGALWSILHRASGIDLRTRKNDPNEGLWDIWMTMPDLQTKLGPASTGRSIQFYSGYDIESAFGSCTITLKWDKIVIDDYGPYPLSVVVSISVFGNSSLTKWTISCNNTGEAVLEAIHFPFIIGVTKLGASGADDFLVYPKYEGRIYNNPSENLPSVGGDYPTGALTMQFMAYYDSNSGFYIAADDNKGYMKHFWWEGSAERMGVLHYPDLEQKNWQLPYNVVLGTFAGDWTTAATIYKNWASRQWWAAPKCGTNSVPSWLRQTSIGWMSMVYSRLDSFHNQTYDGFIKRLKDHQEFFQMPVTPNLGGWEKLGEFVWGDIFPPKLGWVAFDQMVYQVHQMGSRIRLAINPFLLDTRTPLWLSGHYSNCSAKDERGRVVTSSQPWLEAEWASMCIGTREWREKVKQDILTLVQHGADMIDFDGFPWCAVSCYDANHGHSLGRGGNWWAGAWIDLLSQIREESRALNPDVAFGGEGGAEIFLPFLDAYNSREVISELVGERLLLACEKYVPLFRYVYGDQLVFLAYNSEPISIVGEEGTWEDQRRFNTLCIARALIMGEMLVYSFPAPHNIGDPEWDSAGFEFARKCAHARKSYAHRFLVEGHVTKSPAIVSPVVRIRRDLPWLSVEWNETAIQSSAWLSNDDLGLIFTNVWDQNVLFNLCLNLSDYGIPDHAFAHLLRDGVFEPIGLVSSSSNLTFEIKPREILVVVFSAHCTVVFDALPRITGLIIDYAQYNTDELPLSFRWMVGSVHSFEAPTMIQVQEGVRYVFEGWTDGVSSAKRVLNVSSPATFVAQYATEYLLSVSTSIGQVSGGGWLKANTTATVSVLPAAVSIDFFTNYVFEGWKVAGTIVSTSPSYSFTVTGPVSLIASWKTELNLVTVGAVTGGGILLIAAVAFFVLRRLRSSVKPHVSSSPGRNTST